MCLICYGESTKCIYSGCLVSFIRVIKGLNKVFNLLFVMCVSAVKPKSHSGFIIILLKHNSNSYTLL